MGSGVGRAIAYADDPALLFSATDLSQVRMQMASVLPRIGAWCRRTGPLLGCRKDRGHPPACHRIQKTVSLRIMDADIITGGQGPIFGGSLRLPPQLSDPSGRGFCQGESGSQDALSALLPNTRGPSVHARKLYYSVWESVILYGSPVWAVSLTTEGVAELFSAVLSERP